MIQKPDWIRSSIPTGSSYELKRVLESNKLHTVCVEAKCPNRGECWGCGTATFLILGDICTRNCGFCSVKTSPKGCEVDQGEGDRLVNASKSIGLKHVVLTSVDRDDLEDFGSSHYAKCIGLLKENDFSVEALTPDFGGERNLIKNVIESGVDVFAHNIETVKSLTPKMRDYKASYENSLSVLDIADDLGVITKSSILLGLGETWDEIIQTMEDLLEVGVDMLVVGQYLQPSRKQAPVKKYYTPDDFDYFHTLGEKMGFRNVVSKPLARTSYLSGDSFEKITVRLTI